MSPQRKKGLLRLVGVMVLVGAAAAMVFFWPFSGDSTTGTEAKAAAPSPSATTQSPTQLYFNGISKAIKAGDAQKQATYVADDFRKDFVQRSVLMFPKGTTVTFQANTLETEPGSPNAGGIKAVASANGTTTHYVVLLVKEKDTSGRMVWHISHTEKVNG